MRISKLHVACIVVTSVFSLATATAQELAFRDGLVEFEHRRFAKAVKIWAQLADNGDTEVLPMLGAIYADPVGLEGIGIKKNLASAKKAEHYFSKCAALNDYSCWLGLGRLYDHVTWAGWYSHVGKSYKTPIEDPAKAAVFYKKVLDSDAAKNTTRSPSLLDEARFRLGILYIEGRGVKKDRDAGLKLVSLAAGNGLAAAQARLGDYFLDEKQGDRSENVIQADMYYLLAKQANQSDWEPGVIDGAVKSKELEKKMTQEEIFKARQLAAAWRPSKQ